MVFQIIRYRSDTVSFSFKKGQKDSRMRVIYQDWEILVHWASMPKGAFLSFMRWNVKFNFVVWQVERFVTNGWMPCGV